MIRRRFIRWPEAPTPFRAAETDTPCFKGAGVVQADCGIDQDLLIRYLQEDLGGVIPAELYGNPYGEGRIRFVTAEEDTQKPTEDDTQKPTEDDTQKPTEDGTRKPAGGGAQKPSGTPETGDDAMIARTAALLVLSGCAAGLVLIIRKRKEI